jgi:hypothetical protein
MVNIGGGVETSDAVILSTLEARMATAQPIKEQLLREIEKLPEDKMIEVLDFVEFLMAKQRRRSENTSFHAVTNEQQDDSWCRFIGGIDEEPITTGNLDDEIYGQ